MKALALTILSFCLLLPVSGQTDPAALKILDAYSDKALAAPSVEMKLKITVNDKMEQTTTESEGTVVIKKNMYKLEIPDNVIWFNGEATWTLSPEVEEVTITAPDPEDKTFMSNPGLLFTMYKKDFKVSLIDESGGMSIIDLYPEEPQKTEFTMIRLSLNSRNDLVAAEYKRKDGIDLQISISEYKLNKSFSDDYFIFPEDSYPDVDIIDMR